jgi:hypothetical protein
MMDYVDYVSRIRFRFIKPHSGIPLPQGFYEKRLERIVRKGSVGFVERIGIGLEYLNTSLPNDESEMKKILWHLCHIPKMSTLAVGAMINRGVAQMGDGQVFVNVGVWHGFTFLCGMANNPGKACIGVDSFAEFGGPRNDFLARFETYRSRNHVFYEMDCFEYFSTIHKDPIGFYIYDGDHGYESQLRGLQVAEPFFGPDCIILVDDTNWHEPRQATLDFVSASSHGYRIVLDITTKHNCHPTVWNGILILRRVG